MSRGALVAVETQFNPAFDLGLRVSLELTTGRVCLDGAWSVLSRDGLLTLRRELAELLLTEPLEVTPVGEDGILVGVALSFSDGRRTSHEAWSPTWLDHPRIAALAATALSAAADAFPGAREAIDSIRSYLHHGLPMSIHEGVLAFEGEIPERLANRALAGVDLARVWCADLSAAGPLPERVLEAVLAAGHRIVAPRGMTSEIASRGVPAHRIHPSLSEARDADEFGDELAALKRRVSREFLGTNGIVSVGLRPEGVVVVLGRDGDAALVKELIERHLGPVPVEVRSPGVRP